MVVNLESLHFCPITRVKLDAFFFSPPSTESIYRRGARRWRKLYYASGHAFQAKRFNRVRRNELCSSLHCYAYF